MHHSTPSLSFKHILEYGHPHAIAWMNGSDAYPALTGFVKFYHTFYGGVLIEAELFGLPNASVPDSSDFYGMHIHESDNCTPPFDQTGGHYNPGGQQHPFHAGDLPPLLSNQGYAWTAFFDRRITAEEVIGKSVVIHSRADDFTSQPSGNSGDKIACGSIRKA